MIPLNERILKLRKFTEFSEIFLQTTKPSRIFIKFTLKVRSCKKIFIELVLKLRNCNRIFRYMQLHETSVAQNIELFLLQVSECPDSRNSILILRNCN